MNNDIITAVGGFLTAFLSVVIIMHKEKMRRLASDNDRMEALTPECRKEVVNYTKKNVAVFHIGVIIGVAMFTLGLASIIF